MDADLQKIGFWRNVEGKEIREKYEGHKEEIKYYLDFKSERII